MENENKHMPEGRIIPLNGCAIKFKETFEAYHAALCFFAEKLIQDRIEAEDIVEDVFIKLWEKDPSFDQYKNIKSLLYISVKNACFDFIRKKRNNVVKQHQFSYSTKHEIESYALLEIVRAEVLRDLYAAMEKLPIERRTVMQLIYVEGWDSNKVAEHLNISIHTVKKHRLRGIKDLKESWVGFLMVVLGCWG